MPPVLEIVQATASEAVAQARELFLEYQRELGIDLCFQGFQSGSGMDFLNGQ